MPSRRSRDFNPRMKQKDHPVVQVVNARVDRLHPLPVLCLVNHLDMLVPSTPFVVDPVIFCRFSDEVKYAVKADLNPDHTSPLSAESAAYKRIAVIVQSKSGYHLFRTKIRECVSTFRPNERLLPSILARRWLHNYQHTMLARVPRTPLH